jgi:hypothetical protein
MSNQNTLLNQGVMLVNAEYIRVHNQGVTQLIASFELLRDIEERKLESVDIHTGDIPLEVLGNIKKSQQEVWMYAGVIEKLNHLFFTPPLDGFLSESFDMAEARQTVKDALAKAGIGGAA